MNEADLDYYRRRLTEELERSFDAKADVERIAHRKLAELYRARLNEPAPISRWSGLAHSRAN
ncbi:MAG: hypothetical protein EON93_17020 [Burkholderiales bacterium]|nr:MAG: hypothetical protein EON93_17020 [Burkholderiales bacterium]